MRFGISLSLSLSLIFISKSMDCNRSPWDFGIIFSFWLTYHILGYGYFFSNLCGPLGEFQPFIVWLVGILGGLMAKKLFAVRRVYCLLFSMVHLLWNMMLFGVRDFIPKKKKWGNIWGIENKKKILKNLKIYLTSINYFYIFFTNFNSI